MKLVAAIAIADPDLPLRDIAAQLDQMGERPVRGGKSGSPPPFETCWTKPTASALSAAEGPVHQATDHAVFFWDNAKNSLNLAESADLGPCRIAGKQLIEIR